jgi:hypothetical protein
MTEKYHKLIVDNMTSETAASGGWQHVNQVASAAMLREAAAQASNIRGEHHRSEKPGKLRTCILFGATESSTNATIA